MKSQLKEYKEVNSDEAAAKYIENFALKVFSNADNEDRKGGSNRWERVAYLHFIMLTYTSRNL